MTDNYEALLNKSWKELADYKLVPSGSWLLRGRNAVYMARKEEDEGSDKVLFFYQAKEAMDDVDAEEIAALGDYDISKNDVTVQFWASKPKDWQRIQEHLKLHGIDVDSLGPVEALKAFSGTEVIGFVDTRTYKNNAGQMVTDNTVTQFAPVE